MDVYPEEEYRGWVNEASVQAPEWPRHWERDFSGQWEHYVSDEVRSIWDSFSIEQKVAIAKMAEELGERLTANDPD